ncbi:MAG: hypothetical protein IJG34_10435 [Synergistaceae bacterium]|nr:hypothetical protein [Synergistaceae bacterium]MBQ3450298.1 hypothetical protein [Synergistaceae bacterium]MBQ3694620.1 hypothetical protein [Synergistaceae bacterium]MBQ9629394.1 hypothetical protein [Synergistaceae bacterium]MBR0069916.1 hypothetical protein [Synergistaceae bacterium]
MPDNNINIKIKSPEQLDNYIRVTSPGSWLVLSSIIVLLAGFTFWIFTGEIETKEHEIVTPLSFILK